MENLIDVSEIDCTVPDELKNALLSRLSDLTMLPAVASEAIELTNDPEADSSQFAEIVERDIALASQLLSVANSPIFSGGEAISSLHQAVVRLGFNQCRSLIISCSAACLVKKMALSHDWIKDVIWQHSFRTATLATAINRSLKLGFDGDEFTAGLLHDFGRLLLAVAVGDEYPEIDPLEFDENDELLANEEAAIGTNHCCFGTWFAKEAGLPDNLIEVIRFHHSSGPFAPHGKLVSLVIAADDMANHLQRKGLASEYSPTSNPGICQLVQHCGDAVLTQFEDEAESLLSDVQDLTV